MANLGKVLKDEISRIAEKEAKAVVSALQSETERLRSWITQLEARLAGASAGSAPAKRGPGRPPKKRGPGRPPKKRGPGRPKKAAATKAVAKKRGPGRPKKKAAAKKATAAPSSAADRVRVSSSTIRKLRSKFGLTQAEMGKLLGVSGQSVYQWERREGPLRLRRATREAYLEVRDLGAREAQRRLQK